jgi:hypothetical protein
MTFPAQNTSDFFPHSSLPSRTVSSARSYAHKLGEMYSSLLSAGVISHRMATGLLASGSLAPFNVVRVNPII